jgi:hypothetical protein
MHLPGSSEKKITGQLVFQLLNVSLHCHHYTNFLGQKVKTEQIRDVHTLCAGQIKAAMKSNFIILNISYHIQEIYCDMMMV